ncbi:MAG: cyclophilin-like fold protein [Anaerolineae bacterium]|nr:cyclophilin-like fold protein [Anaerolineae bacterium]
MSGKITITAGSVKMEALLNDSPTAQQIWDALPITGQANVWGDEIYFEIPVWAEQAPDARAEVEVGELGYWPLGHAFCIFFGPTPVSTDERPRAYSPVNIVGRVLGDPALFRQVPAGSTVTLSKSTQAAG